MLLAKITKAQGLFAAPNKAAIVKFMEKYPVHPPNGTLLPGHFTAKAPTPVGRPAPEKLGTGHVAFSKQKLVNLVDRVGFIRCIDETSPGEKGALSFEVKFADELKTNASRAGFAPIWWLPWNGEGALVKLHIERSTMANLNFGLGIDQVANPNLFFTAAINGCSIFAYGDLDGPTVYHAGLTGDVMERVGANAALLGDTSEEVWGSLLNKVTFSKADITPVAGPRKQDTKANFSEVNRSDYVAERKGSSYYKAKDFISGDKTKTTKRALDFQTWLEKHPVGGILKAYSLSPWGCVFGIRTGNAWEMYLQRNATVIHATARKSKSFGAIKWGDLTPTAPAQVSVVTLGLQKVFPTTDPVHYRDFQSVTFI